MQAFVELHKILLGVYQGLWPTLHPAPSFMFAPPLPTRGLCLF